jgi:hypothetical protein
VRRSCLALLAGLLAVSACRDDSVTPTATTHNAPELSKMRPGDSIPGSYIVVLKTRRRAQPPWRPGPRPSTDA